MQNSYPENTQNRFPQYPNQNRFNKTDAPSTNNHTSKIEPVQSNRVSSSAPDTTNGNALKVKRIKLVAYGGKAAFQIEQSITTDGRPTVSIESANKGNPGNRNDLRYKWEDKINFQLTQLELPVFCATALGLNNAARFDLHGSDNSKFFEIINQGKSFYFKMGCKDKDLKVAPVTVVETYQFGMLALNEYAKNFPDLSSDSVLMAIRLMTKQLSENGLIKQPAPK